MIKNFIPNMIINCVLPHFRITYWLASDKGRYFRMSNYLQSHGQDIWLSVHYKEASSNKKTATEDRKAVNLIMNDSDPDTKEKVTE